MAFNVYADNQKKFTDILVNFGGTLTEYQSELILQRLDHNYLEGLGHYTPYRYLMGLRNTGRLTLDKENGLVNAGRNNFGGYDKKKSEIIYCLLDLLDNPEDICSVRYNAACDFWDFIKDGKRYCLVSFNEQNAEERVPFLITQHESELAKMPVKAEKLRPVYIFLIEQNNKKEIEDLAFDKVAGLDISVPCILVKSRGGSPSKSPVFEYYSSNMDGGNEE